MHFDEAHRLNALAAAAGADSFGLLAVPSLVLSAGATAPRRVLAELGAVASDAPATGAASAAAAEDDATGARFWHDAPPGARRAPQAGGAGGGGARRAVRRVRCACVV